MYLSSDDSERNNVIKRRKYLLTKKLRRRLNKTRLTFVNLNNLKQKHKITGSYLNLNKLNNYYRQFIKNLYENILTIQQKTSFIEKKNQIQVLNLEKSFLINHFRPINSSIETSSTNSLTGYTENCNISIDNLNSISLIEEFDRFSSILFENKNMNKKKSEKKDKDEEMRVKNEKLNMDYSTIIEPVQKEIMPEWSSIEEDERKGIKDLYRRWESSLNNNFNQLKTKQKVMKSLNLNDKKYAQKGKFNYDLNRTNLKKVQLDLLNISTIENKKVSNNEANINRKMRPNTRLMLKSFKQFLNSFDSLEKCSVDQAKNSTYWSNMNLFLNQISKAILRCAFYVHESANLIKASVGLPPIYVIESDDIKLRNDQPIIRQESLYEYVYLCKTQLNLNERKQKQSDSKKQNLKFKFYKLILNCLFRLIQLTTQIRDSIMMKDINHDINNYSHYISNECKLIKEYLKEIIQNNDELL